MHPGPKLVLHSLIWNCFSLIFICHSWFLSHAFDFRFLCLQLNLLSNGFRLLKAGGLLVYSTCRFSICYFFLHLLRKNTCSDSSYSCFLTLPFLSISLTVAQNEDVVEQFLKENASAGKLLFVLKPILIKVAILWSIFRMVEGLSNEIMPVIP